MAKKEADHREKINKMKAHTENSGCVIRCISRYEENKPHSHRWHAAEQARGEPSVYPTSLLDDKWRNAQNWKPATLAGLMAEKAILEQAGNSVKVKAFSRAFVPFPHNAHHIIPVGVLWANVISEAVNLAKTRKATMFDLVIGGFLTEPYNHNDRPNMITLPTQTKEGKELGLPLHLARKERAHTDYSKVVAAQVSAKVPPKYQPLADEVNAKKHKGDCTPVKVRNVMLRISERTYKAIIAIAKAQKGTAKTLNQVASDIAAMAQGAPK